jgi:putative tryptophan/tyrosine transport system substrate-binding protein
LACLLEDTTMMRRAIGLLVTLALTLLATPPAADAQTPGQVSRIGILASGSSTPRRAPSFEAFRERLRELGWMEGQNFTIEMRWAEGSEERLPELAVDLIRLKVDVIMTVGGTAPTRAAQQATSTIPIVMVGTGDPVGRGFVASLARPGGNITGNANVHGDLVGKRLEVLKEAVPRLSRVAVLMNPTPPSLEQLQEAQIAARALGVELLVQEVRSRDEFERAFSAMTLAGAGALLVFPNPSLLERHLDVITTLALQSRLPAMYPWRMYMEVGGLMYYGNDLRENYRRAAVYVDKLLKGTKPADLPVEQPMKLELVINLTTAQALGLTIPPSLLFQADEVIR